METERLILRRFEAGDRAAFQRIWGDDDVWRSLRPGAQPDERFALERLDHHLDHWRAHGFGLWAAEVRGSGEVVGWAGASHPTFVPELADEIEVGWTLRRPFWGQGLASEGARAAVRAALDHLAPRRLISLIHPANERSIAVASRLGMRHERDVVRPWIGDQLRIYALSGPGRVATGGGRGARRAT